MKKKIAVIDTETDPFLYGRVPIPFCAEFHCEKFTKQFWGNDCIEQLVNYIETVQDEYLIYAHNGGKFDFIFISKYIDNPIRIINSRIVSAKLFHHTIRDSYSIIPIPLGMFEKVKFDYSKMEKEVRQKHKKEIMIYLHSDCVSLLKLVTAFVERFGPKITVGATAIKELSKRHKFTRLNSRNDLTYRPFYFGGRVECFRSGILKGPWKVFDVNSMYPKAMRDYDHPVNGGFVISDKIPETGFYFIEFTGSNKRVLPIRTKDGLSFGQTYGRFFACCHEIRTALKYKLITIDEIHAVHVALETIRFEQFVDDFYSEKVAAKLSGDLLSELFSKFMLNSAYGKFATNPENFEDYYINHNLGDDIRLHNEGWFLQKEYEGFEIWSKPSEPDEKSYYDVSIAASITSAARAILLEGIQNAINPIYCDTDSLICKSLNMEISKSILGAWKLEADADYCAIAGKKLYAVYNDGAELPIKLASKGGNLTLQEIKELCTGKVITSYNQAPTMSINYAPKFIKRNMRSTVDNSIKPI